MSHLYSILTDNGEEMPFRPNVAQVFLQKRLWYKNIILKARKLGFTTWIGIYFLDSCLFNPNTEAAVIADSLPHAMAIFRRTIRHAYDNILQGLKDSFPLVTASKTELQFANGSVLSVGTSMRSGSPQLLHISEFGPICARYPDKAQEIVTGSLQSVASSGSQQTFIESTAAGRSGHFWEYTDRARNLERSGAALSKMDYKFHFFAWFQHPGYVLDQRVPIPQRLHEYFEKLRSMEINLTNEQKWWYTKKREELGPDILSEFPSTPDEAFEAAISGAYFSSQFVKIREQKRICKVPREDGIVVDTWWDLGMRQSDTTAIWFTQDVGREIRVIDFYENYGEGLQFYANVLAEKKYIYGVHHAPHDIKVREMFSGKSRIEQAAAMGLVFEIVPRVENKADSIEAARNILSICWFDEEKCADGIEHLENYRKEWDDIGGTWKNSPLHDVHSNGADAFQTFAMGHGFRDDSGITRKYEIKPAKFKFV